MPPAVHPDPDADHTDPQVVVKQPDKDIRKTKDVYKDIPLGSPYYQNKFKDVPRHLKCSECEIPWRWPRNISYSHMAKIPKSAKPSTKATIVAYVRASDETQEYEFNRGEAMGLVYDDEGYVKEVTPDGQADVLKISTGDQIVKVGDEKFSKDKLEKETAQISKADQLKLTVVLKEPEPVIPWEVFKRVRLAKLTTGRFRSTLVSTFEYLKKERKIRDEESHLLEWFPCISDKKEKSQQNDAAKNVKKERRRSSSTSSMSSTLSAERREREFYSLLTLSSWYMMLAKGCFIDVLLAFMDHYANMLLIVGICIGDEVWKEFPRSKYLFSIGWIAMFVGSIGCTYTSTEYELKAKARFGDLSSHGTWWDKRRLKLCLFLFNFFNMDSYVKDVVMNCHPWRTKPYAAVKIDGTRAHIIGHGSKSSFEVVKQWGNFYNKTAQLVLRSIVFTFKLWVTIHTLSGAVGVAPNAQMIVSCISSLPSLGYGWMQIAILWMHRQKLYDDLMKLMSERTQSCKGLAGKLVDLNERRCAPKLGCGCSAKESQEYDVAVDILNSAFWISNVVSGKPYLASVKSQDGKDCKRCGRNAPFQSYHKTNIELNEGQDLQKGCIVELANPGWHDAAFGVLAHQGEKQSPRRTSTRGKVKQVVGKSEGGTCKRCLVEAHEPHEPQKPTNQQPDDDDMTYWYDEYCLTRVSESVQESTLGETHCDGKTFSETLRQQQPDAALVEVPEPLQDFTTEVPRLLE